MKTILLCIIASVFFISCSADADFEAIEHSSSISKRDAAAVQNPSNSSNPFDRKGLEVYNVLALYYQNNENPNSVGDLTRQIGHVSEKVFANRNQTSKLILFTDELVQSIMNDPDSSMISIVQNSVLTVYTKNNLIGFLQNLITKRQEAFSITYNYIIGYEAEVLNDTVFSSDELETILTVSSISRYSLYSAEERKDRDWETNVGGKPVRPFFGTGEVPIISLIALLSKII